MTAPAKASSEVALEYIDCYWGEMIIGTKEQLQQLGLGIAMAFPTEPGGAKRSARILDPRGFVTKLERYNAATFLAEIKFPGRSLRGSDIAGELRDRIVSALQRLPRPPKLTARSGIFAQHAHDYPSDGAYLAFREKLLTPSQQS